MPQINIGSILGGIAPMSHFAGADQFRASLGIDPAQPMDDGDTIYSTVSSGLLRPAASEKFSGSTIEASPLWIKTNPKNALIYVYDAKGSVYTVSADLGTVTALSDAGTTAGLGNGFEYYDNYLYFFTNTDVTRYGPLNGSAGWVVNYWTSTLGKAALANTTYPTTYKNKLQLPNHCACRHSDGRLYFCDVVGNVATIHYIATTTTSVEGDTNNSSTYNALDMGYGLWPTAIETYGSDLAIAMYEGSSGNLRQPRAKIGFWDTTAASPSKVVWVEFPDTLITAMKNVNGVLYVVSGNVNNQGFRVSQFLGGYTFQEIFYSETGEPCLPGAIDGVLNRVLWGTHTTIPTSDGCVYSYGLQKAGVGNGTFNVMRATGGDSSTSVTSLLVADNTEFGFYSPIIGWSRAGEGSSGMTYGLDKQGTAYNNAPSYWWSQMYRIGKHFKITRIRIPLVQPITTNMTIIPKVYVDEGTTSTTLETINSTNYSGKNYIVYRPGNLTGRNNFWLELKWTGSALLTVSLPIVIDFEVTDE